MTEILTALLGSLAGGGLTGIITWRATRKKADADAMMAVQDVYQQALADQQEFIEKLQESRNNLISEREGFLRENNELRKRQNEMEKKIFQLANNVERNNKLISGFRPMLCGKLNCSHRVSVEIDDDNINSAKVSS